MSWEWDRYHDELLKRTNKFPPLMRREYDGTANWLAPRRFPLPVYRLLDDQYGLLRRVSLAEHPCDPSLGWGVIHIEPRKGIVEHIFLSSLIWSLVQLNASERHRFFGVPFTDIDHPTVGYLSWREIPALAPEETNGTLIAMSSLLTHSLAHLENDNYRESACSLDSFGDIATLADEAQTMPQIIVYDRTGGITRTNERTDYLLTLFTAYDRQLGSVPHKLIILGDNTGPHRLALRSRSADGEHLVCVDAPLRDSEYLSFLLGWERWSNSRSTPLNRLSQAKNLLKETFTDIQTLGMGNPVFAYKPCDTYSTHIENNQATFDIFCTFVAQQNDGLRVQSTTQLSTVLMSRMTFEQREEARCALWAFLLSGGFKHSKRVAYEQTLNRWYLAMRNARTNPKDTMPFDFLDAPPEISTHVGNECVQAIMDNPILISIFNTAYREKEGEGREALILLSNEALALGLIAQSAVVFLEDSKTGFSGRTLSAFSQAMDLPAWKEFVTRLFCALDEARKPLLARKVLHNMYPFFRNESVVADTWEDPEEVNRLAREQAAACPLGGITYEMHVEMIKRAHWEVAAMRKEEYADAVIRASLDYNLRADKNLPEAWKYWVGCASINEDFAQAIPNLESWQISNNKSYLRSLLEAPIPACDNALLLLRFVNEEQQGDAELTLKDDLPRSAPPRTRAWRYRYGPRSRTR